MIPEPSITSVIRTNTTALDAGLLPMLQAIGMALPDFSRIYGRLPVKKIRGVDAIRQGTDEKPRRLPIYYDADLKNSIPIVPDEKQGGLLFVVTTGMAKPIDWTPGMGIFGGTYQNEYPVAILAWWNAQNGSPVDTVRETLLWQLGKCFDFVVTGIEDQLADRVFRDIDYDFNKHTYLIHPYEGLRIEGLLTIREDLNC